MLGLILIQINVIKTYLKNILLGQNKQKILIKIPQK